MKSFFCSIPLLAHNRITALTCVEKLRYSCKKNRFFGPPAYVGGVEESVLNYW